jgi:hypothetical protein
VNETEVLEAIRDLGGKATAAQVMVKLSVTDHDTEAAVLVAMGGLLSRGKLKRIYGSGDLLYSVVGSNNHEQR